MAIKAKIPSGQNYVRTSAMYQWDYGQTLEIEAENLPSLIEVHFACRDMTEAVVHTCFVTDVVENGVEKRVAVVDIPDRCLEQSSEITAWVYEIDGTAGRTIYSVSIPITARTRPARSESVPQHVQDTYTQLIDEVNELLEAMRGGTVNVGYASKAGVADKATTADTATSANTAGSTAFAVMATKDGVGNVIDGTYMKIPGEHTKIKYGDTLPFGLYQFYTMESPPVLDQGHSFLVDLGSNGHYPAHIYSPLMCSGGSAFQRYVFTFNASPDAPGYVFTAIEDSWIEHSTDIDRYVLNFQDVSDDDLFTIYYRKIL